MYEIFEKLLKERGLSLVEFSKITGIPKSTLYDWKKGKFKLKDDKRRTIADYFDVSLDYLDGLTDIRDADQQGFFLDYGLYRAAEGLSGDKELLAVVEKAIEDKNFRQRLLGIVELMENDR